MNSICIVIKSEEHIIAHVLYRLHHTCRGEDQGLAVHRSMQGATTKCPCDGSMGADPDRRRWLCFQLQDLVIDQGPIFAFIGDRPRLLAGATGQGESGAPPGPARPRPAVSGSATWRLWCRGAGVLGLERGAAPVP